jgi:hypothetical protein
VLSYGDYTDGTPTPSSTGTSTGTGGSGGAGSSTNSTGSAGGAAPTCLDAGTQSIEICGNGIDEDCDGTACSHQADWAHRYVDTGGLALDRAVTAVATVSNRIAAGGWYNGTLSFGADFTLLDSLDADREPFGGLLGTDGEPNVLVPTLSMPSRPAEARGVALNAAGDTLAVTGFVKTGSLSVDFTALFVSHSGLSATPWITELGGMAADQGGQVAFDTEGNVLVTGTLGPGAGKFSCSGFEITSSTAGPQLLVALLAAKTGACLWGKTFAADLIVPQGLLIDPLGQVIVVGAYKGKFPGTAMGVPAIGPSTFVLALDAATGATRWARAYPVTDTISFATPTGVAAGTDGLLYVSGSFVGTASFDTMLLSGASQGVENAFVMALHGTPTQPGTVVWAERFGAKNGFNRATAIGTVPHPTGGDDLFVAGLSAGPMSVDPDGLTSPLCPDGGVFLLKLRGAATVWGDCFGPGAESGDIVRMANHGNRVVLGGARKLPIAFGKTELPGTTFDAFLAQFSAL